MMTARKNLDIVSIKNAKKKTPGLRDYKTTVFVAYSFRNRF